MGLGALIFGGAVAMGAAAGGATYCLCWWLGRPDIGRASGVLTGIVWTVMWIGPMGAAAHWLTTDVRIGLRGPQANAALAWLEVPPGKASDVCYRRTYQSYHVDFRMSEADFLQWMQRRDWPVQRFTLENELDGVKFVAAGGATWVDTDIYSIRRGDSGQVEFVTDGYCHYHRVGRESSVKVLYDMRTKRVYLVQ